MIETVTFDLWQTVFLDTLENLEAGTRKRIWEMRALLGQNGYRFSEAEMERAYEESGLRIAQTWKDLTDLSSSGQVRIFLECLAPGLAGSVSGALFDRLVTAYITPVLIYLPDLTPGTKEALHTLKGRGIRLALISNTGRTPGVILRQALERLGVLEQFDVLTFSDEMGIRKPHPEIFQATLRKVGGTPGRAVHVGDDLETDVMGAKSVGMWAVQIRRNGGHDPGPDATIETLAEVPTLLERLG